MPIPVSDAEILDHHTRATLEHVHTCQPGQVVMYYPDRCTADVQPLLKRPLFAEDDSVAEYETLPVIPDVPVVFPRGGGFHATFPLDPGDSVLLVFAEGSLSEWKDAADIVEPADVRRHHLSGAFCVPGGWPTSKPPADESAAASALVIGRDGQEEQIRIPKAGGTISLGATASDFAALASKVDAAVEAIRAAVSGHQHNYVPYPGGSAGTPTPTTGGITISAQPSVAASKVKVK